MTRLRCHEAQGGEDTDTGKNFEGGVCERGNQAGAGEVCAWLQVGGVGQHNAEGHGQGEENLAVGGDPDAGVSECGPVWSEECVQALCGAVESQGVDDHCDEEDGQQWDEDNRDLTDALVHTSGQNADDEYPDNEQDDGNRGDEVQREDALGVDLEEVLHEVGLGIWTPALADGLPGVDEGPRDNNGVVDGNEEGDTDLNPANWLSPGLDATHRLRCGPAEAVSDGEVEEEQWDTRGQKCDQVGDKEGATAGVVCDIGETPDVSEPDCRADGGEDKGCSGGKHLPSLRGSGRVGCAHTSGTPILHLRSRARVAEGKIGEVHHHYLMGFEEAVFGCEKEIDVVLKDPCTKCNGTGAKPGTSPETCSKCGGKGQVVYTQQSLFGMVQNVQTCPDCGGTGKIIREKCPDCGGTGYTSSRKKISVSIPAGIDNGQSVRIREKGEPGVNGGPRGDLLVEVAVSRHPIFQRQDMHIFSTVPISFAQAALGGDVKIKTVDGDVIYTVKPGTKTDTKIRLKGKGVPSVRNSQIRGDHYVTLVIQTPEKLSAEAKEALRRFDELSGNSLNQDLDDKKHKAKKSFKEKVKEAFED